MYRNTPSKLQLRDTFAINVFTSLKKTQDKYNGHSFSSKNSLIWAEPSGVYIKIKGHASK